MTPPSNGQVLLNADGTFSYQPNANFHGVDSFTYTAVDATGTSTPATVTLQVASQNDPPMAGDRQISGVEDTVTSVLAVFGLSAGASDVDGDALSFALESDAGEGTATVAADGSFEYSPNADFSGEDSFEYRVFDGAGGEAVGTVTVTVAPVNDPPQATADAYQTAENQPLVVQQSGAPSPAVLVDEDFTAAAGPEFSGFTSIESIGGYVAVPGFEGSFLRNRTSGDPADATVITLNNLPVHDQISIGFLLAVIDSWDGDSGGGDRFTVRLDGVEVFSHTFENSGAGSQSYAPAAGIELARRVDLGFSTDADALDSGLRPLAGARPTRHSAQRGVGDHRTLRERGGLGWRRRRIVGDRSLRRLGARLRHRRAVAARCDWRYLDDGSDQGTAWVLPGFNDNGWAVGPAQLGYGDGDEATEVGFGPTTTTSTPPPTSVTASRWPIPRAYDELQLSLVRDDGAAVYVRRGRVRHLHWQQYRQRKRPAQLHGRCRHAGRGPKHHRCRGAPGRSGQFRSQFRSAGARAKTAALWGDRQ